MSAILGRKAYCPICLEDLDNEPFCSKHGDVSGYKWWRYRFPVALFFKLINK